MDLERYKSIKMRADEFNAQLVAVSKTKPNEDIRALYEVGHRVFWGEPSTGAIGKGTFSA